MAMKNRKKIKRKKTVKLYNKKLCKKYPWLIPDAHWYTGKILKKRDWNFTWTWYDDMPIGWKKCFGKMFLEELDAAIRKYGLLNKFSIYQIKEKYGLLECYCHSHNDEIEQIIDKYRYISSNVCIQCGQIDVPMVYDSWISPICFNCFKKRFHDDDKHYSENEKSYVNEEIWNLYKKLTSEDNKDWEICSSYTIRKWSKDKTIDITYDISDTVAKIRGRYEKNR